jgi:hypothetical protein
MTMRAKTKRMKRATVSNPSSLSSSLHGAVDLIDDDDENDATLYKVTASQQRNDNGDDENVDWDAMLARAHERAGAARRSYQRTPAAGYNETLHGEVLPQESFLYPHEGDKPLWRLRCHVSPPRILCVNILNNILARL